ncbi:MAG: DUF6807 family protein [Planctomycetia bacterium]|nr:DUF6807 family protein [Planctomycetia bacterium]
MRAATLTLLVTAIILGCVSHAAAENRQFQITVSAGNHARSFSPAKATIDLPESYPADPLASLSDELGNRHDAQLTPVGLLTADNSAPAGMRRYELHFVVMHREAGSTWKGTLEVLDRSFADLLPEAKSSSLSWSEPSDQSVELRRAERPLLRYMLAKLDESTPERRAETYKVYHHVFDPAGKSLLTKGPGGLFPHHRGLFYGFNRISYGDSRTADTWHCTNGAYESHEGFLSNEAGAILGRHTVKVHWHGQESEVFANEERELTTYVLPNGTLIEFASRLRSTVGPVKLDGDPQHAGFQFRAAQEVADVTNKETYYIRPFGKGAPGETLNWPEAKEMVNLPWHAMSCVISGQRYTIAMLDRPENPKESRFSERDYGRFGSYFEYQLDEDKPLELNYRVWVQAGEMTADEIEAKSREFVEPVEVTVTPR